MLSGTAVRDELFLQRRSEFRALKEVGTKDVRYGFNRQFGPIDLDLRGSLSRLRTPLLKGVAELTAKLELILHAKSVPQLTEHLLTVRAIDSALIVFDGTGYPPDATVEQYARQEQSRLLRRTVSAAVPAPARNACA